MAAAPDGTAAVAWAVQAGARLALRVVRIDASGTPSAAQDLSTPPHSVDAFTVAAGSRELAVAWRESDSTSESLLAAILRAGSRTWSQPTVIATGAGMSTPLVSASRFGPVVVWTSHSLADAALHASRIDQRGLAGPQFALVAPRRGQRIGVPGLTATSGGVMVAWCGNTSEDAMLRVALITKATVERRRQPLASCSGAAPHLLQVGRRIVLNASRAPRLYALTRGMHCTRLDAVHTAGAYRLIASRLGLEAVSASGSADGTVVVRALARPELDDQRCQPG